MLEQSSDCNVGCVFIFEDDLLLSSVMADELHELGYKVNVFSDVSGVGLVGDLKPVLIILDLTLDHTDAVEVIQALSDVGCRCSIQLISGSRFEMLERVKRIGERRGLKMLPVLQKPFAVTDLQLVVDDTARAIPDQAGPNVDTSSEVWGRRVDLGLALDNGWVEVWYQPKDEPALAGGLSES